MTDRVAIIGGGFSGTVLAAQLARRGIAAVLVDPAPGEGVAYGTDDPNHLLNVRAGNMGAWPDDAADFADTMAGVDAHDFAERRQFARYLKAILNEALGTGRLEVRPDCAVAVEEAVGGGWIVRLEEGTELAAAAVVLALGNAPPPPLEPFREAGPRFIANPWGKEARRAIAEVGGSHGDVLIVGTGLTMVDVALSLDSAGHRGQVVAVSRRGLVPRAHADPAAAPVRPEEVPHGNLLALSQWLRRRSATVGWRAAIDSIRPFTQTLWRGLGPEQQDRFLRHARPWWDVHRHRIAPEVAERIRGLIADGRLQVIAGRVESVTMCRDALDIAIRRRGNGGEVTMSAAYAFNCTGPLGSIAEADSLLLRQMLADGIARPDALGMGLEVDDRSRVAGSPRLWAMGPLTKGQFWEIVAVPDIRVQAAEIADDIAEELKA